VARVIEARSLAASRGTTEYDNANFRCPECGSTDVNWVAERTLCMRCSSRMERR
jgi:DNA-directed RNA polymerase subunit RPC12/RpoP